MSKRKILEFAKAKGYSSVHHIGKWRGFDTWEPSFQDYKEAEFPCIGPPLLILVRGESIRMSTVEEAFQWIDEQCADTEETKLTKEEIRHRLVGRSLEYFMFREDGEVPMTMDVPNFVDSPFFVDEPGNWHLKPGAPQKVQDEFNAFMEAVNGGERILKFESEQMMIHQAILFATQAHNGQFRKGTDIPYITHPFEVAQILTANGCGAKLIVAGLLHDTLEDAEVTPVQVEDQFGKDILSLVQSDSENKSLSWEERKQETIDYLSEKAGIEELLLACADKLSNLRSIKADYSLLGDKLWSRFSRGKEQQAWYYSKVIDTFEPLHDYDMYWEISNLYTDIFVTYYIDGGEECLYQSNGQETYCFRRDTCDWVPVTDKKWASLQKKSSLLILPKAKANQIEDEWQAEYPSALCLVRNRNDSHVIVRYAEKLLEEGYTPDTIGDIWGNMGGGIPAETLKAVECAFLAIYKNQ